MVRRNPIKIYPIILAGLLIIFFSSAAQSAKKEKSTKDPAAVMTQAELQSQVMSYADRFASIVTTAFGAYDDQAPLAENRRTVLKTVMYSISAAYTIAAESDPEVALLDLVSMVTLGRLIYEAEMIQSKDTQLEPILEGFRKAEGDIWQITAKVLTPDQQKELSALILTWRRENPRILFFPYIRFSDFAAERRGSKLVRSEKGKGLFKSVETATEQVEEMRLLAERAMFLATRMPLLSGGFADVWFSRLTRNPEIKEVLDNLSTFSKVSERLATVAEQLPDKIAAERDTSIKQAMQNITELTTTTINEVAKRVSRERYRAIKQVMKEFSAERKQITEDIIKEEARMRGLISEFRLTLVEGNKLIVSAGALSKQLGIKASPEKAGAEAPVNIEDYRKTIVDATQMVIQLHALTKSMDQLLRSPSWEKFQPLLDKSVDKVGAESEQVIDHTFRQVALLILITLIGYVVARLAYQLIAGKISKTV